MTSSAPPPPGVSSITSSGARRQVPVEAPEAAIGGSAQREKSARARSRGRQIRPGEDVIQDLSRGRRVKTVEQTPHGVRAVERDIVEVPLPVTARPTRTRATYTSIDGEEYSFRLTLASGKTDPDAYMKCLFAAIREQALGGNPFVVFDAFRLRLPDADDRMVYPLSDEVVKRLEARKAIEDYHGTDEDEEGRSFTLGDSID